MDTYSIYQIEADGSGNDKMFMDYSYLQSHGERPKKNEYVMVYSGELGGMTLDDIWEMINIRHPADYVGRSLSVSDVIVINNGGTDTAYYVDRIGFKEVPEFFFEDTGEQIDMAGGRYFTVRRDPGSREAFAEITTYGGGISRINIEDTVSDYIIRFSGNLRRAMKEAITQGRIGKDIAEHKSLFEKTLTEYAGEAYQTLEAKLPVDISLTKGEKKKMSLFMMNEIYDIISALGGTPETVAEEVYQQVIDKMCSDENKEKNIVRGVDNSNLTELRIRDDPEPEL